MKKIIYSLLTVALFVTYSCNDSIDYEQFDKFIYLTKNGWQELDIEITESGKIVLPVSIAVNGTLGNDKNILTELMYDEENLNKYNFDKYRNQKDLYYTSLPTNIITINNEGLIIPSGEDKVVSKIDLDIQKIDNMYNDYVLPLSIKSVSEYKIAEDKYSKGLFHIKWKNFFSGNYTGELNVYLTKGNGDNDNDNKQTISTKEYYAISLNECYFYAGQFGRNNIERNDFIVKILMENDGTITLSSPNSDLNLNQESSSVKTERVPHTTDKRKEIVTTTIFLKYTYTNLADSDKPKLRAEGSMSMSKEVFKNEIVNN